MVNRVSFVGSNPVTAPQIEESFATRSRFSSLTSRPRLHVGGRPAFADFAMWGQLYNAWTDPTPGAMTTNHANLLAWIHRMLWPRAEGDFEPWSILAPTFDAVARASGRETFSCRGRSLTPRRSQKATRSSPYSWRQDLDPEAAEVSRQVLKHAPREVRRAARQNRDRRSATKTGCLAGLRES